MQLIRGKQLVQAFQNAGLGSRQFALRLIEMVATAVHAIAVYLFNLEEKSHKGDIQGVVTYVEPDKTYEWMSGKWTTREALPAFASIFSHACYTFHEKYPNGAADMAGYWAEDRIFGGVILFDRGKSGTEVSILHLLLLFCSKTNWIPSAKMYTYTLEESDGLFASGDRSRLSSNK